MTYFAVFMTSSLKKVTIENKVSHANNESCTRDCTRSQIKAIYYTSLDVCSGDKGELKTPSKAAHVSSNCWREIQPARLMMTLKSRKDRFDG